MRALFLLWIAGGLLLSSGWCPASDWVVEASGRRRALEVPSGGRPGFTTMPSSATGVAFVNPLPPARSLTNHILMNGSGVALGDVDGDGRCDLFLAGLDGRSALYRNRGGWRFEEITASAFGESADPGFALGRLEASGAVLADLDGDGAPELLVNTVGRGTRLWRNDGKGRFRDDTRGAGLESRSGPSSFALADVDGDGDLDVYGVHYRSSTVRDSFQQQFRIQVVNGHPVVASVNGRPTTDPDLEGRFSVDAQGRITEHGEADRLWMNDGRGRFTGVSFTGGAFRDEHGALLSRPLHDWGLAAMFRDVNRDGIPDLYVCNDLGSPDRFWLGDGRGGFQAVSRMAVRKTSWFSMGVDFGDLDRDGQDDFLVTDMLSRDWMRRQADRSAMRADEDPDSGGEQRPQTPRNTLFVGRGDGTFSEIAWWAGLAASDWSWSPVLLDVDLDGFEDVLITTGFQRDVQDADVADEVEAVRVRERLDEAASLRLRLRFPPLAQANLAFRNRGDLRFEESSAAWGFDGVGISQGMALADLDGDGDLDAVINEQNGPARLLRNESPAPRIAVRLRGRGGNRAGIGARIFVSGGPVPQDQEMIAGGRYLSGDDAVRVFAGGAGAARLDVRVRWRSGRESVWKGVPVSSEIELDEAMSAAVEVPPRDGPVPMFEDVSNRLGHRHVDSPFDEGARQPLLSRSLARLGPAVAWGDLNQDGADDLVIGSGRAGPLGVFLGDGRGEFRPSQAGIVQRPTSADHAGILVVSRQGAGAEVVLGLSRYEGTGAGGLRRLDLKSGAVRLVGGSFPGILGPMALSDLDGDGRLDLFLGGRAIPGRYPEPADSVILAGTAEGWAPDVRRSDALRKLGLVTAALCADLDGDGDSELVVSCEWGPVRILWNDAGVLTERDIPVRWGPGAGGPDLLSRCTGLWQGIAAVDLDEDGRPDLVVANEGGNTPRSEGTIPGVGRRLHFGDFDTNGTVEMLETRWDAAAGREVAAASRERLAAAWPALGERFPTRRGLAGASALSILSGAVGPVSEVTSAILDSVALLNRGDHFEVRPLPAAAQWAPAGPVAVADFDGDGHDDVFLGQNRVDDVLEEERLDAGVGLWLRGDGKGGLAPVLPGDSGIRVAGEARAAAVSDFNHDGRPDLVVTQNGGATHLFRNARGNPGLRVRFRGGAGNPDGVGVRLRWVAGGGPVGPVREVRVGSGYWSQDSAVMVLPSVPSGTSLRVWWPGQPERQHPIPKGTSEVTLTPSGIEGLPGAP